MKQQEVVTIFRELKSKSETKQWIGYPELEEFFDKDYYIEDFKQTIIGHERYMLTFIFRRYSATQH
jgi:hypothetical protein